MITECRISVPRFQRSPVDTYQYNQMIKIVKSHSAPLVPVMVEKIRNAIIAETGFDPYYVPVARLGEFVKARQLFMYFVRRRVKLSQSATGRILGKDHSTVNHAENCVERFKLLESDYRELYERIENKILKN